MSVAWELRKSLTLFAAVRPVRLFHADYCPLKEKLAGRVRTADIGGTASTAAMGDAIAEAI